MAKAKANSIVITAHGRIDKTSKVSLPYNLVTTCKLGETHHGTHLDFSKLSIFTSKHFLNNHILTGNDDYTNQGEVVLAGSPMPQIFLNPCSNGEYIKRWSWQKPHIIDHFKKICIYELKDLPGNPYNINYLSMPERMGAFSLSVTKEYAMKSQSFKLLSHINILADYDHTTQFNPLISLDPGHGASMTTIPSSGMYIFDYENGPSTYFGMKGATKAHDTWTLQEAITSINTYCNNNGVDITGADYVLKACLE